MDVFKSLFLPLKKSNAVFIAVGLKARDGTMRCKDKNGFPCFRGFFIIMIIAKNKFYANGGFSQIRSHMFRNTFPLRDN